MRGGQTHTQAGWIVARTKPLQESYAERNVRRQGSETLLLRCVDVDTGRVGTLFPGYLFVRTSGSWTWLCNTYGVLGVILGTGGVPAQLSSVELDRLRGRLDERGLVPVEGKRKFRPGQSVRITDGPFWDRTGIFAGTAADRIAVLLELLGRKVRINVPESFVEAL